MEGGGRQGFQVPIADDSFVVDGVGALGNAHSERGLTYVEISLAGHMYVVVVDHTYVCGADRAAQGTAILACGK